MPAVEPGGGGASYPDGDYDVISSESTIETVGGIEIEEVEQVIARALPSRVVFPVRFSGGQFTADEVIYFLRRFAGYFNALAALPHVVGVETFQDMTASNELQDLMRITVASNSGRLTSSLVEAEVGRDLDALAADVAAQSATLSKIEGSH